MSLGPPVPFARPAFPLREAHAHLYQLGRSLGMIQLEGFASPDEMLVAFAARAGRGGEGAVLLGQGARPEAWAPARWPTLAEFDGVTGAVPALAWCFDYHAIMANSAALALAGIGDATPDPPGGVIGRTPDGGLSGAVYEGAALMVWHAIPEPSPEQREAELRAGLLGLAAFEEVHDLKSERWLGPALARLLRGEASGAGRPARFRLFPLVSELDAVLETRGGWESDRVRLAGAKIFVDGTLNSRTAWMLHPFADGRPEHPRGTPMMTPREIEDAVQRCDAAGLPLAAHAIGDAAVRAVRDAIERVRPRTPGFRIEHAEVIDGADVARFAELGVIASVQPCHLLYDIEALRKGLPDRLDRVLPLRELIDAGCVPGETLLFGSDVPIVRADPEDSVLAATARRRADMPAGGAIEHSQAISEAEAWAAFRAAGV